MLTAAVNKGFPVAVGLLAVLLAAACTPLKPPVSPPAAETAQPHPLARSRTATAEAAATTVAATAAAADATVDAVMADAPPPADPEVAKAPELPQRRILAMEMLETGRGSRVSLKGDGPIRYKLFQLDNPPRLLLAFPATTLGPAVQPRTLDSGPITGLFPREKADGSSNLEIILGQSRDHDVSEQPDGLDVTILSGAVQKADKRPQIRSARFSQDEKGTRIHLLGAGVMPTPQTFRLNNPPRLVMDLFGVDGPAKTLRMPVATPEAQEMELAKGPEKVRLTVDLADPAIAFRVGQDEGMPVIHLTHQTATVTDSANGQTQPGIQAVDFTRDGLDGVVRIRLNQPGIVLESRHEEQNLLLTLKETAIPAELTQRMDVKAFGGPVTTIDAYAEGGDSLIVVAMSDPADQFDILQKEQEILVRIQPAVPAVAAGASGSTAYEGEKISMDFKDIDIQNALRLIAEISGLNIILSDTVTGRLTMRLVDVPWDQALDLMLDARGLGKVLQGNVMRVAPMDEIQRVTEARIQARQSNNQLEPVITEMIPVSFATAGEIRDLLLDRNSQSAGGQGAAAGAGAGGTAGAGGNAGAQAGQGGQSRGSALLSSAGSVSVDERTNTLIVKDVASNMVKIREMVALLDRPVPQVLIEARIVTVDRNSSFALGINWGMNLKDALNSTLGISDSAANAYTAQQDVTTRTERRPRMTTTTIPMNVNLKPGSTTGNLGIHLGSISPIIDLDIEIGALESGGKAKTISSPRVLTVNGHQASISQGVTVYYPAESQGGGTTMEPQEAELSLSVRPQVSPNGYVTLDVDVTNDSVGSAPGSAVPPILTKQVTTKAMIKDGETLVLGGIFQNIVTDSQGGVPKLKEIPGLGWLFKNKITNDTQSELLVFITPRIVGPS